MALPKEMKARHPDSAWEKQDSAALPKAKRESVLRDEPAREEMELEKIKNDPPGAAWKASIVWSLRKRAMVENRWLAYCLKRAIPLVRPT